MKDNKTKNVAQMSKFEATMIACQRAKASALKETKKIAKPKATATLESKNKKRAIKSQNKKTESILRRRMVEEEEYDPEMDEDLPEDTVSDAVIVVDPELDTDEYEANLDDLQAIIDDTPEGEVPSTDTYVGDFVYTCPICGNNFFSDNEMSNEPCPVCGEEVDEFILVGDIAAPGAGDADVDVDLEDGDEEVDVDLDVEEPEEDDELDEELDIDAEIDDTAVEGCGKKKKRECLFKDAKCKDEGPAIKKESYKYLIDESTLNPFLTKFIKENYKNATSMKAVGARISGRTIKIECEIKFKSGSTKKTTISLEGFAPSAKKRAYKAKADSVFKVESKRATPFVFEAFTVGNKVIRFAGMKYNFITKKEGKRLQVFGNYALKENRSTKKRTK